MPLDRIPFDQTNRPIYSLLPWALDFQYDAPYQRGSVWTVEQQRNLIKSLMQALPVGVIFLNYRDWKTQPVVVDGKQRLEAILAFISDGFSVPAAWFADAETEASERPSLRPEAQHLLDGHVVYSQLTEDTGQGRFKRNTIAFYETRLPSVEDERDLYLRINTFGSQHTPQEIEQARKS